MMRCPNCQAENIGDAHFCHACGTQLHQNQMNQERLAAVTENKQKEISVERVTLCADGKYRWVYEYPMMKNPALLFTIIKVLCLCAAAPALVVFFSTIADEGFIETFLVTLKVFGVTASIIVVLSLISYVILAASYGWKYVVVFEMDEEGIEHIQQQKQFEKAQVMGIVAALVGVATKNHGATSAGLVSASHSSIYSRFTVVKKIKGDRHRNVIKVNSLFAKNQIYVMEEDYEFVWHYITSRCPKAKVFSR